jgi:hypothetical protein
MPKLTVASHSQIDERNRLLAEEVARKIDADPHGHALARVRALCARWLATPSASPDLKRWQDILARPWAEIRAHLLDLSEEGTRLRQSSPFCGVLSPRERWRIYKEFKSHDTQTA